MHVAICGWSKYCLGTKSSMEVALRIAFITCVGLVARPCTANMLIVGAPASKIGKRTLFVLFVLRVTLFAPIVSKNQISNAAARSVLRQENFKVSGMKSVSTSGHYLPKFR